MNNRTYTQIIFQTTNKYVNSLNLKYIFKLFINSLIFRGLIYSLLLIIPPLTPFIMPSIITYIFIIKPYLYSKKNLKLYFENIFYTILILITLFVI